MANMTIKDVPDLIAFRPNIDDKERIVRLAKKTPKNRKLNMSALIRRGLELIEREGTDGR
jgi:hypothetical protein